jgi:uncharacterized protein (DUF1778 family)
MNREVLVPEPYKPGPVVTYNVGAEEKRLEQVKLRLTVAEAESIRGAAAVAGQTISEYVVNLHERRISRTPGDLQQFAVLAEVGRRVAAIPEAARKLDADLGRLSGRLKDLFATDYGKAMAHQDAINLALRNVRALRAEVMETLSAMIEPCAEARDAVLEVMVKINRERKRDLDA